MEHKLGGAVKRWEYRDHLVHVRENASKWFYMQQHKACKERASNLHTIQRWQYMIRDIIDQKDGREIALHAESQAFLSRYRAQALGSQLCPRTMQFTGRYLYDLA